MSTPETAEKIVAVSQPSSTPVAATKAPATPRKAHKTATAPVAKGKASKAPAKAVKVQAPGLRAGAVLADVKPNESVTLVQLCNLSEMLGYSRGFAVKLTGGDGGRVRPTEPVFTVTYVGSRKYVSTKALLRLAEMAVAAKKVTKPLAQQHIKKALLTATNINGKKAKTAPVPAPKATQKAGPKVAKPAATQKHPEPVKA